MGAAMTSHSSDRAAETAHSNADSLSTWRIVLLSIAAALAVFFIGTGLDLLLIREHDTRLVILESSDALGGVVAGALSFRILQYERERRARLRQRIAVIADMNHHVRNALQVITFHAYNSADQEQLEAVKDSMERIQWALKEVLPKL